MLRFSAEERSQGLQHGQMNGAEAEEEEEFGVQLLLLHTGRSQLRWFSICAGSLLQPLR